MVFSCVAAYSLSWYLWTWYINIDEQKLMNKQIMHCIIHVCWTEIGVHTLFRNFFKHLLPVLSLCFAYHKQEKGFLLFQIGHITTNQLSIGWITSCHRWSWLTVRKGPLVNTLLSSRRNVDFLPAYRAWCVILKTQSIDS